MRKLLESKLEAAQMRGNVRGLNFSFVRFSESVVAKFHLG
ncbi:hypothetical protein OROGR_013675 [Orobanche gracilis]